MILTETGDSCESTGLIPSAWQSDKAAEPTGELRSCLPPTAPGGKTNI